MGVGYRSGQQLLGLLGIVGGVAVLAGFLPIFPWDSSALVVLRLVLFNAGVIAIVFAARRRQAAIGRGRSSVAAAVAVGANAWYLAMVILSIGRPLFPEPDPGFRPILFYAAIGLWLADAAFGIVAVRLRAVSRWAALAVAVGSLLALTGVGGLGFTTGPLAALIEPLSLVGIVVLGIGWLVLGIDVVSRPDAAHTPARPAT
jgi:hypothetical protein